MFLDPSLLVRTANATFNAVAESSQVLQCNDIRHCRTLQSIIYSCFSTVFLCTWTALHLDVPSKPRLLRRVWGMLGALVAPEAVFMEALEDWTYSSKMLDEILKYSPRCGWTETHAQFARMGGFRRKYADGETVLMREEKFFECVKDGTIDLPQVSKEEILARSRGDPIAKSIALIQTAWFVIQCIHRRNQHLILTQLEITTLGHTLINFFIYFFWWYKPLGVAFPIDVPSKKQRPEPQDDKAKLKEGSSNENDAVQVPQAIEERPTQAPLISNDDQSKASEKGLPVATKSSDDKSIADSTKKLEVNTTGETPPPLSLYTRLGIKTFSVSEPKRLSASGPGRIILSVVYFIIGGAFGALHCLAWNSAFPTLAEQYIWQVSSLIVAIIGGGTLVLLIRANEDYEKKGTNITTFVLILVVLIPIYCFARISLLVLALLQLRALTYAAYVTPSWSTFYPHIS